MSVGLDLKKSKLDGPKKDWRYARRKVKVGEVFDFADISLGVKGKKTPKGMEKQFVASGWAFDAESKEGKELIAKSKKPAPKAG